MFRVDILADFRPHVDGPRMFMLTMDGIFELIGKNSAALSALAKGHILEHSDKMLIHEIGPWLHFFSLSQSNQVSFSELLFQCTVPQQILHPPIYRLLL